MFQQTLPINVKKIVIFSAAIFVSGCTTQSGLSSNNVLKTIAQSSPVQWQAAQVVETENVINDWLHRFDDPTLTQMVTHALSHNYQLKADQINVKIAKERLNVSDATDFPELSLSLGNSRRKQVTNNAVTYQTDASIGIDLSYEVDLWGKLSQAQTQSRLTYAATQAAYEQNKLDLVGDVAKVWFNLIESQQLLGLYQERATNLQRNLAMIESSYQLGLNDALDVYLTKNDVNQELARIAEQQQNVQRQSRALELLLGDYPHAKQLTKQQLPLVTHDINIGLPAQLLTRRSDVQASWLELLALDAGLAVAHKQRFPSFNLTASVDDNTNELTNLLDGGALAWSLIGNITTPLFNAGKLESLEQQARLAVEQKEQQYLELVYQAFADVENNLSEQTSLKERYAHYVKAEDNAMAAEKLSFDQYLRGLVTYTTVLESQRRSFDAQTTVIQLTNQLLQNRIEIYLSLGGDYLNANQTKKMSSSNIATAHASTNSTSVEK